MQRGAPTRPRLAPRLAPRLGFVLAALPLVVYSTLESRRGAALEAVALSHIDPLQNPSLPLKALAEALTGTLYEGLSRERAAMAAELAEAGMHTDRAQLAAVAFALTAAVLLAAGATRRGPRRGDMLLVAICCLVPGLCAPVLTLASGTELPLLGRVVLSYEAKSILGVVAGLAEAGAIVPALAVATFSIGVPLVKLLTLAWESAAGAFPSLAGPPGILATATHHAGRWSMVDVFVVAIVVAFTAGRTGDAGATALGLGVWFFGAYALLSQISAQVADHASVRR